MFKIVLDPNISKIKPAIVSIATLIHGDCVVLSVRSCLHGGGGPQVGEVTRLAVVEKWPAFTCKVTTPGSRGDVSRRCCKCNMNSTPARQVTPP